MRHRAAANTPSLHYRGRYRVIFQGTQSPRTSQKLPELAISANCSEPKFRHTMRLALFQPDIPQNTGALIRLAACLRVPLDIIEPCGFLLDDKRLRRAGLDYHGQAELRRHRSWSAYQEQLKGRLLLLTTRATAPYTGLSFQPDDNLLLGRESAGVPDEVHAAATQRLVIPVSAACRSLNVALAAAMVLGEALRQTAQFPKQQPE